MGVNAKRGERVGMSGLGVLSIHLDGEPCRVGCPFCYLGARAAELHAEQDTELVALRRGPSRGATSIGAGAAGSAGAGAGGHALVELERAILRLDYAELAIAVSEPVDVPAVLRLCLAGRSAVAQGRERLVAITTTAEVIETYPELLDGIDRLNLSVDPWKIAGDAQAILDRCAQVARFAAARPRPSVGGRPLEIVAIASLSTPGFAELLLGGLLEALVDLPLLTAVALNALKPPPPFCDRAFWLAALARLTPLLARALDRRLFLDCYVAARLVGTGGCPARPDLSVLGPERGLPAGSEASAVVGGLKLAFRSCVYAPRADALVASAEELDALAARFVPPARCPFDTRLSE